MGSYARPGEFTRVVGDKLETGAVWIEDLATARRVEVSRRVTLHRITDADERLVLGQPREFPWYAARLSIKRDAQAPHHVCAALALEALLADDLNTEIGRRRVGL
jgi:hypothetical protein